MWMRISINQTFSSPSAHLMLNCLIVEYTHISVYVLLLCQCTLCTFNRSNYVNPIATSKAHYYVIEDLNILEIFPRY